VIALAQDEEIQQLLAQFEAHPVTGVAVQELEVLVRAALFKQASVLVGMLLQAAADRLDAAYPSKPGQERKGRVGLEVQCLFGTFSLERDYYYHAGKQAGHYPADAGLGLETGYTPALARLICLEGADESGYQKAEEHLRETGGIAVDARQVQRVVQRIGPAAQGWQEREARPGTERPPILYLSADGTGVPMRPEELVGRKGKQADGSSLTLQAYLGCAFTQHGRDEKGRPVRDYQSTSYVSCLGPVSEFAPMLRREAIRRGLGSAGQIVFLVDGAEGLECLGRDYFPGAVQIVDFYHAMEHGSRVLVVVLGSKEHPDYKARLHQWAKRLLRNGVAKLIAEVRQACAGQPTEAAVEKALGYFVRNVARMQYGTFRKAGFFIGSGVVEAGCKTVIGARCKQSGMRWSRPGAQGILALRCISASRRLTQFWQYRLNAHAARNDALALAA
jgi:hypothetical protein